MPTRPSDTSPRAAAAVHSARRVELFVLSLVFAATVRVLEHELVYERWIVPRLWTVTSVPWTWWLAALTPSSLLFFLLGALARATPEVFGAAAGVACGWLAFGVWAARTSQPGSLKADSEDFAIPILLATALVVLPLLGLGSLVRRAVFKPRQSA